MPPKFSIISYDRVPEWVIRLHLNFAEWLVYQYRIPHHIKVHLTPSVSMPTDIGKRCWGYFHAPDNHPEIFLACGRPKIDGRLPPRGIQAGFLIGTFGHEFCHYEQWRDQRPINHRGVENRVDALLRRFAADIEEKRRLAA